MTAEVRLRLSGRLDHLRMVWQAAEALLEDVPFREDPVQTRYNLLLATQEAVSNILRHGYHSSPETPPIELRLKWDGQVFRIELRDRAAPFDPTQIHGAPDPDARDEIPESGYGIHIIRAVIDDLHYERIGSENVLVLEKALAPVLNRV